jgi:tryptophan synthase beta chain
MDLHREIYIPKPSPFDPDKNGHFGNIANGQVGFGGRFVPETLMPALEQLLLDYEAVRFDKDFWSEVDYYYKNYVGRPSSLYFAENLSKELDAKIYLKREDLNHTGAHKINHCVAQAVLAKRLGKRRLLPRREQDSMVWLQLLWLRSLA